MDALLELHEKPTADEIYLIAGWRQWADAGAISSALVPYLIKQLNARKIGQIKSDSFYLFQLPGTQHFLRPEIKLEDGHRKSLDVPRNEIYFADTGRKGLAFFIGDEPHVSAERYAEAFFHAAQELGAKRVVALGGVYAPVPYDKDRQVTCTYSLRRMKDELSEYAVRFSNYEGGVSIGSYLADKAEQLDVEYFVLYAFVPMYDFSQLSPRLQGMSIEHDYKAWYDLMRRLNHMFGVTVDLTELAQQSEKLTTAMEQKLREMEQQLPNTKVRDYLEKLTEDFTEMTFLPLDDVWKRELGDLFKDLE